MLYDRTLVQIRERSFLDLLDLTLLVVRERPLTLGLTALAGIAPFAALNASLLSDPQFPRPFWLVLLALETPWATAPLVLVMGDLMFDARLRLGRMAKTLLVSLPALVVSQILLRWLSLILIVTYPVMPAQYSFLDEIILLERVNLLRVFRRSRTISQGLEGELFARWLGQLFLGTTFAVCVSMSARTVIGALVGSTLTWYEPGFSDMNGLLFQTAVWVAIAFFGVYRFLAYIDRRIRLEGWELELRLKDVGRSLQEKLR
jgi:hypothetical protein